MTAVDSLGQTALMRAANGGHTDRVTALLAAPGLNMNAATVTGRTALMWAVVGGHAETVTALLASPGLNVNVDRYGQTALMQAVEGGHAETVTALLAAPGLDVNATDRAGWTELMRAAYPRDAVGTRPLASVILHAGRGRRLALPSRVRPVRSLRRCVAEGHRRRHAPQVRL